MRYAIVPSQGRYSSGNIVYATQVCRDFEKAKKLARQWTKEYQASMRKHGGTSGGYRVVVTTATNKRSAKWLGHELDRIPTSDFSVEQVESVSALMDEALSDLGRTK